MDPGWPGKSNIYGAKHGNEFNSSAYEHEASDLGLARENNPANAAHPDIAATSFPFQRFQFVQGARPVFSQQTRQASVRKELSTCLTVRTVVGLVVGIADALYGLPTPWARQSKATVDSHLFSKRRHFLWEVRDRFSLEPIHPDLKRLACCCEQSFPLLRYQLMRQLDWRELRRMQDLVRVRIPNPA